MREKEGDASPQLCWDKFRQQGSHAYRVRIEELVLPGNPTVDFLCADCANRRDVKCSVHGVVNDTFFAGSIPTCSKCSKDKEREKKIEAIQTTHADEFLGNDIHEHLSVVEASISVLDSSELARDKCGEQVFFKLKEKAFEKKANARNAVQRIPWQCRIRRWSSATTANTRVRAGEGRQVVMHYCHENAFKLNMERNSWVSSI